VEAAEKNRLLSTGFATWSRNDFYNFLKMAQTYGRKEDKLEHYQELLPHKSLEDITSYSKSFWINY
jgi:hypothetical protein